MKTYNQYMKRKGKLEESIKDFNATQKYANQNMAIAINQEEEKVCVSTMKNGTPNPLVYTFNNIIGSEILEDGVAVAATSSSSDSGSDIAGGIVLDKKVKSIDLKILIDDLCDSFVLANFLFWEVSKDSKEYQKLRKDALYWHGLIDSIIKGRA